MRFAAPWGATIGFPTSSDDRKRPNGPRQWDWVGSKRSRWIPTYTKSESNTPARILLPSFAKPARKGPVGGATCAPSSGIQIISDIWYHFIEGGRLAKKIAVINQKGGVGKTTTAVNLGTYLAKHGKKVLLLDLDPQGNATSGLGFNGNDINGCVYNVLIDSASIHRVKKETKHENLHIAPASINLAAAEVELVAQLAREHKLKAALNEVADDYHYVIIDCPPSLGLLTVNGLVAADLVLIPVQAEYYALEGLGQLLSTVKRVRTSLNPNLDLLGVLVTMFDRRTTLSNQVHSELKKHFGDRVFDTIVPRTIRLAEAPSHGKSIHDYDKLSKGAFAYKNLAKEVIKRCQV